MKVLNSIPPEVAALIPKTQLEFTKENLIEYSNAILRLQAQLKKCPRIKETDKMKEHPAIFHYFFGETGIYICEYDRKEDMFGFVILNSDIFNSEFFMRGKSPPCAELCFVASPLRGIPPQRPLGEALFP